MQHVKLSTQLGVHALTNAVCGERIGVWMLLIILPYGQPNSSVQFSFYVLRKAHNYVLHPVSQKFPQRCLWNGSNVRLIDDGPLSSFQGRLSSASSFHTSPPDDRWCDVLGSVPAGSVSSFSTLQIFQEASHLWGLLCPQDYLNTSIRRFISISGVSQCCHRRRAQDYCEHPCS